MTAIRRAVASLAQAASPAPAPSVHFHRGPHGDPVPCFDHGCSIPKLDV